MVLIVFLQHRCQNRKACESIYIYPNAIINLSCDRVFAVRQFDYEIYSNLLKWSLRSWYIYLLDVLRVYAFCFMALVIFLDIYCDFLFYLGELVVLFDFPKGFPNSQIFSYLGIIVFCYALFDLVFWYSQFLRKDRKFLVVIFQNS